jgi:hypothetical protein
MPQVVDPDGTVDQDHKSNRSPAWASGCGWVAAAEPGKTLCRLTFDQRAKCFADKCCLFGETREVLGLCNESVIESDCGTHHPIPSARILAPNDDVIHASTHKKRAGIAPGPSIFGGWNAG